MFSKEASYAHHKKYSKNNNIMKIYYNLKYLISIWIYFKMFFEMLKCIDFCSFFFFLE